MIKPWRELDGHSQKIACHGIVFSPNGNLIISTSNDSTVKLWDWETESAESKILWGSQSDFNAIAISQNGKNLAACGDTHILIWDLDKDCQVRELIGHKREISSLQFLDNGLLASASEDGNIRFWDIESGITRRVLQGHSSAVRCLAVAENSGVQSLYSTGNDGTVKRWNTALPGQWLLDLPGEPTSSAINPTGSCLALSYADGVVRLYAIPALQLLSETKAHEARIYYLNFSPDGSKLVSSGAEANIKIWTIIGNRLTILNELKGHLDDGYRVPFSKFAFAPNGIRLAAASHDGYIGLFNLEDEGTNQFFKAHDGLVTSVCFDPSGNYLFSTGYNDFVIKRWDLTKNLLDSDTIVQAHNNLLWNTLSPDGRCVAYVGAEQIVTVHNLHENSGGFRFRGHESMVYKAIFSADGHQLASVSKDMTVRLWDLDTHNELFCLRLPTSKPSNGQPLWDFDFRCTPTGCWIAVPLTSGKLALYNLGQIDYSQ